MRGHMALRDYANHDGQQRAQDAGGGNGAAFVAKMAIGTLFVLAALAAIVWMIVLPLTEISRFEVSGAASLGSAELSAWSGLPAKSNWFTVDCDAVATSVAAHPAVASASAWRRFPNAVVVRVVERSPVAVVYAVGDSARVEAHCVDGEGVVFAPASAYAGASSLPVLSGLEIKGLRYGLRLGGPFPSLLASLAELRSSEPALVSAISELRVVSRNGAPVELLLYPARYRVPVRMRPVLNAGLLKSMMLVLDVVEGEGLSPIIRELDLRTDTFVYHTKEAVSG